MIYLSHEIATLQSEAQRFDDTIAQLTAAAAQQDQAATAARNRAAAFQAQATADDAQAADLGNQIADQRANEPPKSILGDDGKLHPNPDWEDWKAALADLTGQRNQALAAAAADRAAASAAEQDAAAASASAAQLRQQAAQVGAQKDAITQQIAAVSRWQQEIARTPLDRGALEAASRELAGYASDLESQYAVALDLEAAADKQEWYLQTLVQELSSKISILNTQLPPAVAELEDADAHLFEIELQIQDVMRRQLE